jgi:hypothetical protein
MVKKQIADFEKEQLQLAIEHNVSVIQTRDDQLVVISDGVFEGEPLEAARYPSPDHMSGWWLTTDKYNGDVNTLRTEHAFHLCEKRPEVVKYLSLPYGFRFRLDSNHVDVWFDEKVANEEA